MPPALNGCPKCKKSPNLVALFFLFLLLAVLLQIVLKQLRDKRTNGNKSVSIEFFQTFFLSLIFEFSDSTTVWSDVRSILNFGPFATIKICPAGYVASQSKLQILRNAKQTLQMLPRLLNFDNVAKFRQIWSHCTIAIQDHLKRAFCLHKRFCRSESHSTNVYSTIWKDINISLSPRSEL